MIQTRTALCVIAAVASGLFLYSEKRQALMIDRETGGLMRATADLRTRTALLRAEWSSMLEPEQLQSMVSGHLPLQPIAPTQFVQLGDLGAHLPPPEAASAGDAASGPDDAAGSAAPGPAPPASPARPPFAPPFASPLAPPFAPPLAPPPGVSARAALPRPAQHRPAIASAGTLQAAFVPAGPKAPPKYAAAKHSVAQRSLMLAAGQDRAVGPRHPIAANTYRAIAGPAGIAPTPFEAPSRPFVASALGNGVALSPPVPYGQ